MPDPPKPAGDAAYSPTSGCIIMFLAVVVLGGSATFFVVQGFRMDREIDTFTSPHPAEHPVAAPGISRRDALRERLRSFGAAALDGQHAELALSASDLNDLIAIEPFLRDFRGNTHVIEVSGEFIIAAMSQKLNSLRPGTPRYLNARFHFRPRRIEGDFDFALVDISGSENPIPQGFIDLYSQRKFFKPDPENPTIGPVLEKIVQVEIRGDKLVATTAPTGSPAP